MSTPPHAQAYVAAGFSVMLLNTFQVMAGVPTGQEAKARELAEAVKAGLVRVNAAIEAK